MYYLVIKSSTSNIFPALLVVTFQFKKQFILVWPLQALLICNDITDLKLHLPVGIKKTILSKRVFPIFHS